MPPKMLFFKKKKIEMKRQTLVPVAKQELDLARRTTKINIYQSVSTAGVVVFVISLRIMNRGFTDAS